jgi:hypothetical protein
MLNFTKILPVENGQRSERDEGKRRIFASMRKAPKKGTDFGEREGRKEH